MMCGMRRVFFVASCMAVEISRKLLKVGENVFSFFTDTQSGSSYISIDSVWLEPIVPDIGTILKAW